LVKVPKGYFTILDFMTMNEFQRNVALSEYKNLLESGLMFAQEPSAGVEKIKTKARRKKSAYSKALSRELKDVRRKATLKSGKLRKGMTPAKILKKAHRQVKRRLR
jgi:hypothetical protein